LNLKYLLFDFDPGDLSQFGKMAQDEQVHRSISTFA